MNASDLTMMRATAEEKLTSTATVSRLAQGKGPTGGKLDGRAPAGSIKCKLAPLPMQGGERGAAAQTITVERAYITTTHDADVMSTDRLTVAGGAWEVKTVERRDVALLTRMLCEKVGA